MYVLKKLVYCVLLMQKGIFFCKIVKNKKL